MSKREGRDKMSNGNISLPGDYEDLLLGGEGAGSGGAV